MKRLRKATVPADLEAIPEDLRSVPRWVVWDFVINPKKPKPDKVPLRRSGDFGGDWTSPAEWRTFAEAVAEARRRSGGIGFVFTEDDDLVGVDLDNCYSEAGELKPWGAEILERFSSIWAEKSPSGSGIHFIGRSDKIDGTTSTKLSESEAVERYSQARWFTFSGNVVNPAAVGDARKAMAWLEERFFSKPSAKKKTAGRGVAKPPPAAQRDEWDKDHDLDVEVGRLCLEYLSATTAAGGDAWRRAGMAAKAVGEELKEPWFQFSRRWPEADEAELEDRWVGFRPHTAGVQTLIGMAFDDSGKTAREINDEARRNLGRGGAVTAVTIRPAGVTVVTEGQPAEALRPACVNDPQTHNELSLARRLVRDSDGEILYVVDRGVWMKWTGKQWREDREGLHAQRITKGIASKLWEEIANADPQLREMAAKFAAKASSRRTIEAAIALAKSEPEIAVEWSAFDRGHYLFNCQNGTLDLADKVLSLRPHQKSDRLTQIAGVKYDANAAAPNWQQFVSEVTCGDDELGAFHQRSFGLALSSDQSEQRLWVHHGNGGNGKGTFLSMIAKVMGSYAGPVSASVFVSSGRDSDRDNKTAQLVGKRLAFAQEADDGSRLSESSVKAMTGSDVCTARYLYQNPFEVNPTWHIHLAVNHRPSIKGRDAGIWRRVLLTPWRATFDGEAKRDRGQIEAELFAEGAGILNWMIQGFQRWREEGLRPPSAVQAETNNYRNASDSIAAWMAEECFTGESAATGSTDLFVAYKQWCYRAGFEELTQTSFGRALEEMGYEKDRPTAGPHRNKVVRKGLGLVPSSSWAGA